MWWTLTPTVAGPGTACDKSGVVRLYVRTQAEQEPFEQEHREREPRSGTMSVILDKEALRQKYEEERKKRVRPDGPDQYQRLTGRFAHYLTDPYTPVLEREPVTDHVTFAFI